MITNETLLFFKLAGIPLTIEEINYPAFFKEAVSNIEKSMEHSVAVMHQSKISIMTTLMQKDSVIPVAMLLIKYIQKLYSCLSMNKILIPDRSSEIQDEVNKICRQRLCPEEAIMFDRYFLNQVHTAYFKGAPIKHLESIKKLKTKNLTILYDTVSLFQSLRHVIEAHFYLKEEICEAFL